MTTTLFEDIPFQCCTFTPALAAEQCVCNREEHALRRYSAGHNIRPMTPEEREWCVYEADRAGEGYYNEDELEKMSDKELAYAVLNAWKMYVDSHF
jgi:hypothetical protein